MCTKCPTPEAAERHRGQIRQHSQQTRLTNKLKVIEAYGGCCACCSEREPAFLCVDHVADDGAQHRQEIGQGVRRIGSGSIMYAWLIRHQFPEGFQLLCANCNMAKQSLGQCPHVWM